MFLEANNGLNILIKIYIFNLQNDLSLFKKMNKCLLMQHKTSDMVFKILLGLQK